MKIYTATTKIAPVNGLHVDDEIPVQLVRQGEEQEQETVVLTVHDIYEAAPGVTTVAWATTHPWKDAQIEVYYNEENGDLDVVAEVYEDDDTF